MEISSIVLELTSIIELSTEKLQYRLLISMATTMSSHDFLIQLVQLIEIHILNVN